MNQFQLEFLKYVRIYDERTRHPFVYRLMSLAADVKLNGQLMTHTIKGIHLLAEGLFRHVPEVPSSLRERYYSYIEAMVQACAERYSIQEIFKVFQPTK